MFEQALTHKGVASVERMHQSKVMNLVLKRRTCGAQLPDGSECKTQIRDKDKLRWGGRCKNHNPIQTAVAA